MTAKVSHHGSRHVGDPTETVDRAAALGRDPGPASTRTSSKGALVLESHRILRALASRTPMELRRACLEGQLLPEKRARETRERVWDSLHWRFFAWNPPAWVLADVRSAARGENPDARFTSLVYLHYARRDRLTFDFVVQRLYRGWQERRLMVTRNDVLDYLAERETAEPSIRRWRESTRKKLAGNVLSALRDFGLLTGVQRKHLQRPTVASEVVLHLCRLLWAEGLRGRALVGALDWRLLLWSEADTAMALAQLSQSGHIRYERAGSTVMVEVPDPVQGA